LDPWTVKIGVRVPVNGASGLRDINVADPHHLDSAPDPAFYFDADPDPTTNSFSD
jgi:hypothetical protein